MPDRPNIVFLFPDQLRHDMLDCYGHPAAITPNIDALAAGGTRFANCTSTNPVCLPARAGIITGGYCGQHHCHSNGNLLSRDAVCWPALLRDSGYYTALVGKLHLWEQYRDPGFTPVDHGFQYAQLVEGKASFANGVEASGWYFDILRDRGLPLPHPFAGDPDCRRVGSARISEYGEMDHIDGVIGARAVRQILEGRLLSKRRDQPFCMQVGLCSPHEAYDPPQECFDLYAGVELPDPVFDPAHNRTKPPAFQAYVEACARKTGFPLEGYDVDALERIRFMRRCYLATVTHVDRQVGRIVEALQEAGVYENTAILFLSDHGEYAGNRGGIQKGLFLYEDNLHVPLILHAPFLGAAPGVAEGLVQNIDVFATVLDLAGLPIPEGTLSRSLVPLVRDPSATVRDAAFAESFDRKSIRRGRYKLIVEADPAAVELYDLQADPGETVNLARDPADPDRPTRDPAVLAVMNDLLQRLVQWQRDCEGVPFRP
ncbi:MAG: sulfatase [Planctomycetota bacterium]